MWPILPSLFPSAGVYGSRTSWGRWLTARCCKNRRADAVEIAGNRTLRLGSAGDLRRPFSWRQELEDVHMTSGLTARRSQPAQSCTRAVRAMTRSRWICGCGFAMKLLWNWRSGHTAAATRVAHAGAAQSGGYSPRLHPSATRSTGFAHHLLAYLEMFDRDDGRLADCFQRANVCPLGGGGADGRFDAGAGPGHGCRRYSGSWTKRKSPADPKLDGRGPVIGISRSNSARRRRCWRHRVSRLAEDWILWASAEFHFITIADAVLTGSSLMPQKESRHCRNWRAARRGGSMAI